ncbi:DUF302 domain-containing protein [Thalassovita taeanensis]|uniref:DUF302 domain-containing protein n=1 Tax=Thalassovita taeanensis TaxID=657014 RepID=A0A1H9INZ4_9RHOB|nr:DUF302 domain-containing protein [Thalassovita taeanensis]SEQ76227.1 hypothetical protein SAMN04488092_112111 [Thalassovita taeanensis]
MKPLLLAIGLTMATSAALADDLVQYTTDESYADVIFGLENAIVDQGLVIDATSHVGDMLERTRQDVGSDITIFAHADVYSFCSAALSRKVMEADPMNIRFCPYDIFVAQMPDQDDQTIIGYRGFPDGPMKEVEALLDTIVRSAIGLD